MSIPTDRLRLVASEPAHYLGVPINAMAAELLACREGRDAQIAAGKALYDAADKLIAERDAARAETEKLRDQRDRLLRAVRGAGSHSTMVRLADEIEESDDRPIPCETCDGDGDWTPTAQPIKAAARAEAERLTKRVQSMGSSMEHHVATQTAKLTAELAAVKRQRDELLAAADQVADALRDVAGAGHLAYLDAFDAAAAACAAEQPKPQQPEGGA